MVDPIFHIQDALAGRYSIKRELGKGGMATVYLARDVRHDRFVALKVMRPDLASSVGAERFLHACVQARLGLQAEAVATLGTLLSVPFYASPAWLRIDPNFSALRGNPEFERLTREQRAT